MGQSVYFPIGLFTRVSEVFIIRKRGIIPVHLTTIFLRIAQCLRTRVLSTYEEKIASFKSQLWPSLLNVLSKDLS